jgi:hypothetical protein
MEKIILYVDDAVYASEQFAELAPDANSVVARHWVLVACAPRMTHRISKWVSHSARENWRAKWFSKVQAQMLPLLERNGGQVTPVLAKGPLAELTAQLKREHAVPPTWSMRAARRSVSTWSRSRPTRSPPTSRAGPFPVP